MCHGMAQAIIMWWWGLIEQMHGKREKSEARDCMCVHVKKKRGQGNGGNESKLGAKTKAK